MSAKALLLDAGYYPIKLIDWKRAMILFFTGRAEVVEHHEDIKVNSPNQEFKLPKVLRLFCSFKDLSRVKFNRNNVFFRDKHTCQYCGGKFKANELTFDHVVPKSRGGDTSWKNIVSCCAKCNNDKADRTPEEWGRKLLNKPYEPNWTPLMALRLTGVEISLFKNWIY